MAAVVVDPKKVRPFKTEAAFEKWLSSNHDRETELWIKFHKKGSGLTSVTYAEALDVALCWGWIDGIRKAFDELSFIQRFSPRGRRSIWSQINRDHVARLIEAGRMTPHGQLHVESAKADGRWAAAYAPIRSTTIPDDLRSAIEASPRALATFGKLDRANIFALAFRVGNMKTKAGREAKITSYVQMLDKGESLLPMKAARTKK